MLGLSVLQFPADGQTAPQAEAFVRSIYKQYQPKSRKDPGPDFIGRQASTVFSPALIALIRRDAKNTPKGDVGKMDYDPICVCQDPGGLQLKELRVESTSAETATAFVTLFFGGDSSVVKVRLRLVRLGQDWRIDDIETKETPSLRKYLQ